MAYGVDFALMSDFPAPAAEDSVLRCLIDITLDGLTMPQVTDAIGNGDHFLIVLQWGETEEGGKTPRLFATIPADAISVAEEESEFELVSSIGLDLDQRQTRDLAVPLNRRFIQP